MIGQDIIHDPGSDPCYCRECRESRLKAKLDRMEISQQSLAEFQDRINIVEADKGNLPRQASKAAD